MVQDHDYMAMAIDLARLGLGRTSPNPAVGAVIVKNGKILATGFHKKAGMPHAGIEAFHKIVETNPRVRPHLRQTHGSTPTLKGATLYVTLEPCCHHGRTPPCTDAIIKSGLREVVIGMRDPDVKVSGKGIRILKKAGLRVREGVLKKECEILNENYIKHRKTGMPFVTLKVASTWDGKAASRTGNPRWMTGSKARNYGHLLRDRSDAILVGINTVLKDNPKLTTRLRDKNGKDPVRIILDTSLRLPLTSKVLHVRSNSPTWIVTAVRHNHPKLKIFEKKGVRILFCPRNREDRIDLKPLLKNLGKQGIIHLLVEGGPSVWSSFLKGRLADKLMLFMAPTLLGEKGIPAFPSLLKNHSPKILLKNIRSTLIERDLLIEADF